MSSPKIASVKWGQIDLQGVELTTAKDCKVYPGGARIWDWSETGTRHQPGIQQADVEELVRAGATAVVLSQGMDKKLGVPNETVEWLKGQGIEVHVAETREAVGIYNDLAERGIAAGACFHSTC